MPSSTAVTIAEKKNGPRQPKLLMSHSERNPPVADPSGKPMP